MISYDFYDGNGPVPAHQHPNGGGWVADTATVADTAYIGPYAKVFDKAIICGNAQIYDNAKVFDNAKIFRASVVYNYARVFGKAKVYGVARVYGNAKVFDTAIVSQDQHVKYGNITTNLTDDIPSSIKAQTNLDIIDGKIICYKKVDDDLSSMHDSKFKYEVGKIAKVDNPNLDPAVSCAAGLHFSNKDYYWSGSITLQCSVDIEDIIAVQEGKIRVKKAMVLGIV